MSQRTLERFYTKLEKVKKAEWTLELGRFIRSESPYFINLNCACPLAAACNTNSYRAARLLRLSVIDAHHIRDAADGAGLWDRETQVIRARMLQILELKEPNA